MYTYSQRQKERDKDKDREIVLPFSLHTLNFSEKSKQDIFHSCGEIHFKPLLLVIVTQ